MRRPAIPCIGPRSRRRCPLLSGDAAVFCSSLVDALRKIDASLAAAAATGSVSLRWCAEAMRLLKSMQAGLLALFKNSGLPVSSGAELDWFDQYMQETATLLDFCNALRPAVSRFHRYCMVVDFAAQTCSHDGSFAVVGAGEFEMKSSETCHERFLDVKVAKDAERLGSKMAAGGGDQGDKDGIALVMLVAKITMFVVSFLIVSALVLPVSIDLGRGALDRRVPDQLKPWSESLSAITGRFREQFVRPDGAAGLRVAEHEKVDEVVRDLHAKLEAKEEREGFLRCLEMLKARSVELKQGVEMFDSVLGEVFDEVIRGRNEMLGVFRDKTLTLR